MLAGERRDIGGQWSSRKLQIFQYISAFSEPIFYAASRLVAGECHTSVAKRTRCSAVFERSQIQIDNVRQF